MVDSPGRETASRESRWFVVFVFGLMLIGLQLAAGPTIRLSLWKVSPQANHGLMEAHAWRQGRLDLAVADSHPERGHGRPRDTAYRGGKVYNVFPPLFTFLSFLAVTLQHLQGLSGADADGFYAPWYVALVAGMLPLCGFWAFRAATGRSLPAALLTAYLILGTPLAYVLRLENCGIGSQNEINHALCTTGLLLIAGDLLGKRRIWPAAIGLLIGLWTRQLSVLYLPAIVYVVWHFSHKQSKDQDASPTYMRRRRALAIVGIATLVGLGTLGTLNNLKFGSVFDSGYESIYVGREGDMYADRFHTYGRLFDLRFIPRNAWHMNLSPPTAEWRGMALLVSGHPDGTSIWMTSPLLLVVLWDARRWWRDPARRALMLCSAAVIFSFLCYHNSGSVQRGFFRFALDVIPVWLAVMGSSVFSGKCRWFTFGALGWSALYFQLLV